MAPIGIAEMLATLLRERGLTTEQLAGLCEIEPASLLSDIVHYDNEIEYVVDIEHIINIGRVLGDEFWRILGISCPMCGQYCLRGSPNDTRYFFGSLLREARLSKGLSTVQLGDALDYQVSDFFERVESGQILIDQLPLEDIREVSTLLSVPLAKLLVLQCTHCSKSLS
jgi:transcriptional regulator with XRE-family HTH domain